MLVRIVLAVFLVIALVCAFFVRSESGLEYTPIRYTMYKYEKYDVFRRAAGQQFQEEWNREHPDRPIRVFYEPIGGNYEAKLNTEVVANTVQDLFFVPDYFQYAKQGTLLDLTPHIEKNRDEAVIAEIYPSIVEPLKMDGHLYALPGNLNTDVLYYNRTLFRRAGVDFPDDTWDWNDMLEAAKKLTIRDDQGRMLQYGLAQPQWLRLAMSNGGRIWSEDGNRCAIDSEECLEAFQFVLDLVLKYHVSPTPKEEKAVASTQAFQTNRAGMMLGGRWWTAVFWEVSDLDWSTAPVPLSPRGRRKGRASFNVLGINSKTRNPEVAYAFLKFLTLPEQVQFLVELGDSIPMHWRPEHNEYFLNEPRSEPGANKAYVIGMEHPYTEFELARGHPDLPSEEFNWLYTLINDKAFLGQVGAKDGLAVLRDELQKKLKEYRTPVKTVSVWPFAPGFAAIVFVGIPVCLWLRRKRQHGTE